MTPLDNGPKAASAAGKRKRDTEAQSSSSASPDAEMHDFRDTIRQLREKMRAQRARLELELREERQKFRTELEEIRRRHADEIRSHQTRAERLLALLEKSTGS